MLGERVIIIWIRLGELFRELLYCYGEEWSKNKYVNIGLVKGNWGIFWFLFFLEGLVLFIGKVGLKI